MRRFLSIILLAALPALAQQPSVEDMRAVAQAVSEQRNQAQDAVAQMSVVLRKQEARREEEVAKLKTEVERLMKVCGKPCEAKEEPKK